MGKSDKRSHYFRLACGHIRSFATKADRPSVGELKYCLRCDEHLKVTECGVQHHY